MLISGLYKKSRNKTIIKIKKNIAVSCDFDIKPFNAMFWVEFRGYGIKLVAQQGFLGYNPPPFRG